MKDYKPRIPSLWEVAAPAIRAALLVAGIIAVSWILVVLLFALERQP